MCELLKDSARPLIEIARKVGASRQTVAKKIQELKAKGIISAFTAELNPTALGLKTKAYVFLQEDPRAEIRKRNETIIKKMPNVGEFHRLFGRYSAILVALVKDGEELKRLVRRIHKLKGVRGTETFIVHSTLKDEPEAPLIHFLKSERS